MTTIVNTHVGISRGKKRIYFEGVKLEREGFKPGMRFDVTNVNDQLNLTFSDIGKYKVSRRKNRVNGHESPVIDITAAEMAQLFDENDKVKVIIKEGVVLVSAHHSGINTFRREDRLLRKLKSDEKLSICSLCHGGGVLDSAFHHGLAKNKVSSSISIAIEIEPKYLESSLRNNAELWDKTSIVCESAVQDVDLDTLNHGEVDVVIAGIPCVGASKSGISKNKIKFAEEHSTAGAVFFHTLNLICKLNPSIIVIENVPEYANTASMAVIRSVLQGLNYSLQERVIDSSDFGCIEKRKRLAFIAISKGIDTFNLDRISTGNTENCPKLIKDILDDVPDDSPRWKSFDYLTEKASRDALNGKGFKRQLLTEDDSKVGVISRGYAKCRSTEPFLVNKKNNTLSRIFTPLEHARLKRVPSKIINGLSETIAHEILGQGVAFSPFYMLAKSLSFSLQKWRFSHW